MKTITALKASVVICGYVGLTALAGAASAEPVTTGSLVREMVDLRRLCEFPSPSFKTVQYSSYDRRSNLPGGPDWFANSDGFGKEPIPNFESVITEAPKDGKGEYVICDVKGPGAIVRVWTARIAGRLRMYLDGSDTPTYDGNAGDFLQKAWYGWAKSAGIDEEVFEATFRQREAGYYPIPFAKGCKLVFVGNHRDVHFYQVQVRLYEPSARVVTFTPEDLRTYKADIERVSKVLADPDGQWPDISAEKEMAIDLSLAPGQKVDLAKLDGPGAIERLTLKTSAGRIDDALRQTVLQVICDDFKRPQVESPIGDFFGAAPGINPYVSLPFTVKPDGTMISRFVMPFAKNVRVVAHNRSDQEVKIAGSLLPGKYVWDDAKSMHFVAHWRASHELIGSNENVQDIPYIVGRGKGVFVGVGAYLLNPCTIPSASGNWWGEGDEKIFIDDDVQPSTFGTGSEDYFNYAWSSADIFAYPYCGQPRNDGPINKGFVTNFRWQIVDCMPFQQSFAFYMELYPHTTVPGFSYCRTAYCYARPGLMDDILPIAPEDLRHLEIEDGWLPVAADRATGATFLSAEDILVTKDANISMRKDRLYAGGNMMVWQPREKGETLTLKVPIEKQSQGNRIIHLIVGLDAQSGMVSATFDGNATGFSMMDLYTPYRKLLRSWSSRAISLKPGEYELVLRYEGPSPAGAEIVQPTIGLDFLWVQEKR